MAKIKIVHSQYTTGNYVSIIDEIKNMKEKNGKPLSLDAIGFLFILLSLSNNSDFDIGNLAKELNCSQDKIYKLIKALKKYGYCKGGQNKNERGRFAESTYYIYETANKSK